MNTAIYKIELKNGSKYDVFCQSYAQIIRLNKVIERMRDQVLLFELQPQKIHTVKAFEMLNKC